MNKLLFSSILFLEPLRLIKTEISPCIIKTGSSVYLLWIILFFSPDNFEGFWFIFFAQNFSLICVSVLFLIYPSWHSVAPFNVRLYVFGIMFFNYVKFSNYFQILPLLHSLCSHLLELLIDKWNLNLSFVSLHFIAFIFLPFIS